MQCVAPPRTHEPPPVLCSLCGYADCAAYTRQAGNDIEVDVAKVEELIMERAFLRRNRDFAGADEVRDALAEIGVRVLDKEYEWYAMRKRVAGPPRERDFGPLGHDYTRATDDKTELTDEVEAEINELIRKRLEAKMSRRWALHPVPPHATTRHPTPPHAAPRHHAPPRAATRRHTPPATATYPCPYPSLPDMRLTPALMLPPPARMHLHMPLLPHPPSCPHAAPPA